MRTDVPTVAEVVQRAAALCDPPAADPAVTALVERFEDDGRPARGVSGLAQELERAVVAADAEGDSPAAAMTAAAAAWLATNIEHGEDRERVLREASRAAWSGSPPDHVGTWLEGELPRG